MFIALNRCNVTEARLETIYCRNGHLKINNYYLLSQKSAVFRQVSIVFVVARLAAAVLCSASVVWV